MKNYTLNNPQLKCKDCAHDFTSAIQQQLQADVTVDTASGTAVISSSQNLPENIAALIQTVIGNVILGHSRHRPVHEIKLDIHGLDCANCALKLEGVIKKDDAHFADAQVDFVNQKVRLYSYKESMSGDDLKQLEKTLQAYEPITLSFADQPQAEDEEEHESSQVLSIVQMIVGVGLIILYLALPKGQIWLNVLMVVGYGFVGFDVLQRAGKNILAKEIFDENFLMSLATIGALFIQEYPEAIGVMVFYKIGEYIQDLAVDRSRQSIKDLINIKPEFARVYREGSWLSVDPKSVQVDERISVYAGERIPLDGVILQGKTSLDTSSLTGESMPISVEEGNSVYSGSINLEGVIEIAVSAPYEQSTVKKLMDLIENASSRKAKTELFITRFSKIYTPIVVALAVVLVIGVGLFTGDFYNGLHRGLSFLVISCPCALVLSVPLGFFAGIGKSSQRGILVKGGQSLEDIGAVRGIIFDKTGTLTKGEFKIDAIKSYGAMSQDEILEVAALVEAHSNHPLAQSIVASAAQNLDSKRVSDVVEESGLGVSALVDGKATFVGNLRGLTLKGISVATPETGTSVYVSIDNKVEGVITLSDELKDDSKDTITFLKRAYHLKTWMLSGDKQAIAEKVSKDLDLDGFEAELLPDQKVEAYLRIKEQIPGKVAYVGDGLNDAAVLALSDVGITMGEMGHDIAIESADIVLTNDDPYKIVDAIKIGQKTTMIVKENIMIVLIIKGLVLALAALNLANMWLAIFADVGVALLAILNSTRVSK